jgi:hypothetical protein
MNQYIQIAAAIQTLQQLGVTALQLKDLFARKDITPDEVQAQLNQTDSTLDRLKKED